MKEITSSKKYQNGVQVIWTDAGSDSADFFTYEELIDMKINAFDILNNPNIYRIDPGSHSLKSSV